MFRRRGSFPLLRRMLCCLSFARVYISGIHAFLLPGCIYIYIYIYIYINLCNGRGRRPTLDCSGFNKTTFRLFSLPQVNLYSSKL